MQRELQGRSPFHLLPIHPSFCHSSLSISFPKSFDLVNQSNGIFMKGSLSCENTACCTSLCEVAKFITRLSNNQGMNYGSPRHRSIFSLAAKAFGFNCHNLLKGEQHEWGVHSYRSWCYTLQPGCFFSGKLFQERGNVRCLIGCPKGYNPKYIIKSKLKNIFYSCFWLLLKGGKLYLWS